MLSANSQLTEDSDLDARMQIQDKIAMISGEVRTTNDAIAQLKEIQVPSTAEHSARMAEHATLKTMMD